jgi:hypothetical protein
MVACMQGCNEDSCLFWLISDCYPMCGSWYSALDRSVATGKVFVDPSYLFFFSVSDAGNRGNHIRGGPLEIPGGRGGGWGG